jgi:hypothetical protein
MPMPVSSDETLKFLAESQAALLLAESLMLVLLEAKLVDKEQLVDAIETVIATKRSMIIDGKAPEVAAAAIGLLSGIANSLTAMGEGPAKPPSSTGSGRRDA